MIRIVPRRVWILLALLVLAAGGVLFYNRPVELRTSVLMSTPLVFSAGQVKPFEQTPPDLNPPLVEVFYATDREPTDRSFLYREYYGNDRSLSLRLGAAKVRFGDEEVDWEAVLRESVAREREQDVPIEIADTERLGELGSMTQTVSDSLRNAEPASDRFRDRIERRLANSAAKDILIFVPGFKVDFTYPVLVAAELWHYLGYRGAALAYSWPSRQRIRDYLLDTETAMFTAQHFRMLLRYLAERTSVEKIHILCYSAGARICSQALHELRLSGGSVDTGELLRYSKIGQVILAAPDIDMMLFASRYRDDFEDIAEAITIYTNANDTALMWALRFLGSPRLGAPGDLGLTPGDLRLLHGAEKTVVVDVAAAEETASGNGHGYFVKSPWVSTDLLLALRFASRPAERGLRWSDDEAVWQFPEDYPDRIRRIVAELGN